MVPNVQLIGGTKKFSIKKMWYTIYGKRWV